MYYKFNCCTGLSTRDACLKLGGFSTDISVELRSISGVGLSKLSFYLQGEFHLYSLGGFLLP